MKSAAVAKSTVRAPALGAGQADMEQVKRRAMRWVALAGRRRLACWR